MCFDRGDIAMNLEELRKQFRPHEDNNCQACIHDYLKYEYDIVIKLISSLEHKKLQYQKFFISMVGIIGTVTITLLNYKYKVVSTTAAQASDAHQAATAVASKAAIVVELLSLEEVLGIVLVISAAFGYGIVRNLASVRMFECFYANTAIKLRDLFIECFNIKDHFINLSQLVPSDRHSSDYIMILICNLINLIMLAFGLFLMIGKTSDTFLIIFTISVSFIYFGIHIYSIERYLRKPVRTPGLS